MKKLKNFYWSFSVGFRLSSSSLSFWETSVSGGHGRDARVFDSPLTTVTMPTAPEAAEVVLLWSILLWGEPEAGKTAEKKYSS